MTRGALITAGGSGTRMGAGVPKQYLDLMGLPVLARTIQAFQTHALIDVIVVTVPPGDEEYCRSRIVVPFGLTKVRDIVPGGATRQESVLNGLQAIQDTSVVAIHDGVRPLVGEDVITRSLKAAEASGAAVACVPVKETVKRRIGPRLDTVPRWDVWLAHTPQTFRTNLILEAHRRALQDGFSATDDASLVERLGLPVEVVEDSEENIKITTPADMEIAAVVLARRCREG